MQALILIKTEEYGKKNEGYNLFGNGVEYRLIKIKARANSGNHYLESNSACVLNAVDRSSESKSLRKR